MCPHTIAKDAIQPFHRQPPIPLQCDVCPLAAAASSGAGKMRKWPEETHEAVEAAGTGAARLHLLQPLPLWLLRKLGDDAAALHLHHAERLRLRLCARQAADRDVGVGAPVLRHEVHVVHLVEVVPCMPFWECSDLAVNGQQRCSAAPHKAYGVDFVCMVSRHGCGARGVLLMPCCERSAEPSDMLMACHDALAVYSVA